MSIWFHIGAWKAFVYVWAADVTSNHSAPMPLSLASFLVEFLSHPGDLVAEPFSGSFTTALAAERLGRRWLGTECMVELILGGASRFEAAPGFVNRLVERADLSQRLDEEI